MINRVWIPFCFSSELMKEVLYKVLKKWTRSRIIGSFIKWNIQLRNLDPYLFFTIPVKLLSFRFLNSTMQENKNHITSKARLLYEDYQLFVYLLVMLAMEYLYWEMNLLVFVLHWLLQGYYSIIFKEIESKILNYSSLEQQKHHIT